jgi:hypothetical protein
MDNVKSCSMTTARIVAMAMTLHVRGTFDGAVVD